MIKFLIAMLVLSTPAVAHSQHQDYFENTLEASEVSADTYLNDYLNHGFVTGYGRPEVIMGWDITFRQNRLVVPAESMNYFKHPYNEFVTTW